jgi:ectoine hydroxylase-related dioxygenase (phytanoyl-CoA dioxygenase family)
MSETSVHVSMNAREKYLFDLQGFLVVRAALSPLELKALNEALDANHHQRQEDTASAADGNLSGASLRGLYNGMLTWDKPWCQPFRDLLAHRTIIPYLNTLLGRGWKLDHDPFIFTSAIGTEGLRLHGAGSVTFNGSRFYKYQNGHMRCGLINCQYQLTDVNPGDGGLMLIPGSHKSNYACPDEICAFDADQEVVQHVPMRAGDLVIFNEATTHGTLPWKGVGERRSLFYRYSPKYLHYTGGVYETILPDWTSDLTEVQRAVLEPPYVYHRPLIENDGDSVVSPRREGE